MLQSGDAITGEIGNKMESAVSLAEKMPIVLLPLGCCDVYSACTPDTVEQQSMLAKSDADCLFLWRQNRRANFLQPSFFLKVYQSLVPWYRSCSEVRTIGDGG